METPPNPNKQQRIGYTTGVFDLFHIGHLNILRCARDQCDRLIVGLTTDELCFQLKGKLPVIPYIERRQILKAIRYVDLVVPQAKIDEYSDWKQLGFHIIFKGSDWQGSKKWAGLESTFKSVGVAVQYFPYTETTSSTLIKQTLLSISQPDKS